MFSNLSKVENKFLCADFIRREISKKNIKNEPIDPFPTNIEMLESLVTFVDIMYLFMCHYIMFGNLFCALILLMRPRLPRSKQCQVS